MTVLARFLTVLSVLAPLSQAYPALQTRDISLNQLSDFTFWVQYANAAYCANNYDPNSAGTKVGCLDSGCPEVEATNTTIAFAFSGTTLTDTAGFVAIDHTNKHVVLSFRGSFSIRNWITDAIVFFTDPELCTGCRAELGFWSAWTGVRDGVIQQLQDLEAEYSHYDLVLVGHSLGAAIATLAGADLRSRGHKLTVYAYGSPRVGNEELAQFITDQGNNYRFTHTSDPVPKLPLLIMNYVHISPEYHISAGNNVTVRPQDVEVYQGHVNFAGNTGTGLPLLTDFPDHSWYFRRADGCKGEGLPF
ncbi:lipase family protein [Aspergillus homomorphus CBS 101889]|uniref:feruloyl esterase n=1 Tax=Aspergillus homomorphus (strain CBS 101889) TaxID=1450537 RepID=A0A395HYU3_ASPHC|nr:lipase [Aspergillus homomorphus CBS 101889]RAL12635.1 lipase [Aspergillus homomorphus CBS 101889]